jgi:hypothetical protein
MAENAILRRTRRPLRQPIRSPLWDGIGCPKISFATHGIPVCREQAAELYHKIHRSILVHSSLVGDYIEDGYYEDEPIPTQKTIIPIREFVPKLRRRRDLLDCGWSADCQLWGILDEIIQSPFSLHSRAKQSALTLLEEVVFPRLPRIAKVKLRKAA